MSAEITGTVQLYLAIFVVTLMTQFQVVAADTGNTIAGFLIAAIVLVAVCAGLGSYARRRS